MDISHVIIVIHKNKMKVKFYLMEDVYGEIKIIYCYKIKYR